MTQNWKTKEIFKTISYSLPPSYIARLKEIACEEHHGSASELLRLLLAYYFDNKNQISLNNIPLEPVRSTIEPKQQANMSQQEPVRVPAPKKPWIPEIDFET